MIRSYEPADAKELKRIFYRQGFAYECPDFGDRGLISKTILEKDGRIAMAILARLTAEAYFLVDPDQGTPREKWEAFLELHEAARLDCYARGLDDISCWVPPMIKKSFGRRLLRLGWNENLWPSFSRSVHDKTVDLKQQELCASVT